MKLSLVTEYGIRGMVHLASCEKDQRVSLDAISKAGSIPRDYLGKIFQLLVKTGLIQSFRGRGGGFTLSRTPDRISLLDLVDALEGEPALSRCVVRAQSCEESAPCLVHRFWVSAEMKMRDELAKCTLKDIVNYYQSCPLVGPQEKANGENV